MTQIRRHQLLVQINPNETALPLSLDLDPSRVPLAYGRPATNWRLIGSGGTAPYVYTRVTGTLPAGLTLNADGSITGTPTAVGERPVIFQVEDADAQIRPRSFMIGVASNLSYAPQTIPPGEIGIPFSFTLRVAGAIGSLTFSAAPGALPAGLSISAAGVISGTPTAPYGTTAATVHVVDSAGAPLDIPIVITIAAALTAVLPSPQTELFNGSTVQFDLTPWFTGGVGPYAAKELGGLAGYGLSVQPAKSGRWFIVGTLRMNDWDEDIPPPGSTAGVTITDALGAHVDVAIGLVLRNPVNSLGTQLNGIDAGPRTATKINLIGGFARGATTALDQTMTTFDIGITMPAASVLARQSGSGDPVPLVAPTNTVLCNPAFGTFGWSKVTQLMLSATAAASSARVYGNGDWVSSVSGSWGATSFLVSGTQVVGARKVGWAAATGTATRTTFATTSVTLPQLAEHVKALIDDLIAHGLIGT